MFRTIDDFASTWERESDGTLKVFRNLTDASLAQAVVPGGRTLGFLAWHLTCTLAEMGGHGGLTVEGPTDKTHPAVPAHAADIVTAYAATSGALVAAVRAAWTDAQMGDLIPMYGEQWPKGVMLAALVAHQTHHRGQMTVLMRQAGLAVPGVYGPSKEEWAAMGLPPMP